MALILNIDTSTEVCSVSLFNDGKLCAIRENKEGLNHSTLLTVYIKETLFSQNVKTKELDAVAISGGPGSYTGLRIGTSVAKGICYAAKLPLIAISPLQAMAGYVAKNAVKHNLTIEDNTLFCPMIDARRMEVYTAFYNCDNNIVRKVAADIIEHDSYTNFLGKGKVVFFGNGAGKCKDTLTHKNAIFIDDIKTSSEYMGQLSENAFIEKDFVDVAYYEPFYLKDFVATVPKKNIFGS
jgi:tRNA threonylcarbamoyladenosine biosynthesis protein TsaB